jgi:hypothetical protein
MPQELERQFREIVEKILKKSFQNPQPLSRQILAIEDAGGKIVIPDDEFLIISPDQRNISSRWKTGDILHLTKTGSQAIWLCGITEDESVFCFWWLSNNLLKS